MPLRPNERFASLAVEFSLLTLLYFSSFAFGAVYSWASMAVAAILFFLFFLFPQSIQAFQILPKGFRYGITAVFIFIVLQSFLISRAPYESRSELLQWLAWAAGFLLIQRLPLASLRRLLVAIVILGTLESAYGLFEVLSHHEHILWKAKESHLGFVTGTYLNRNHCAGLLELCLGVHLGFLFRAIRKKNLAKGILWATLFLVTAAGLLATGSRMGVFSFAVSFLFFVPPMWKRNPSTTLYFVLGLLVLGILPFLSLKHILLQRFLEMDFSEGRFIAWQSVLRMIRNHALLGTGLGSFQWVFPVYQSPQLLMEWTHAHNDYLELAASLGIPAFLVLITSFLILGSQTIGKLGTFSKVPLWDLRWGILVSLISFALHGFGDFNFAIPANLFLFMTLCAILIRLSNMKWQESDGRR